MPALSRGAAAACLMLAAFAARGAEWAIEPSIGARLLYNDNIDLQPGGARARTALSVNPGLRFAHRTETRETTADFGLSAQQVLSGDDDDATDFSGSLASRWQGERDQWALAFSALQDSTLRTELETTGVVQARRQRRLLGVSPSWRHALGEATAFTAAWRYSRVRYEAGPGLVNYDDQAANLGLQHVLSSRWTLGLNASAGDYRTEGGDTRSRTLSATLSAAYQHSERLSFNLEFGRQRTTTEQPRVVGLLCSLGDPALCQFLFGAPFDTAVVGRGESRTAGTTYAAAVGYLLETGSLSAAASRGVTASGSGTPLRTERMALGYGARLSETLSWSLDASWVRSRNADGSGGESRYQRVGQGLQWQLERGLALNLGLSHAVRPAEGGQQRASATEVSIGMAYSFPPVTRSR